MLGAPDVRSLRVIVLSSAVLALALFGLALSLLQARPVGAQSGDPLLERGEYLVTAGPCAECHTVRIEGNPLQLDQSMLLAGGEQFDLPFGTIYSANITSDVETGIGSWSVSDIVRALDEGLDKDGNPLVLMPWQSFRGLSSEDKIAIALYLKSTTPIKNEVPAPELSVPSPALHADAAALARPVGLGAAPSDTDAFARGEYLIWNLGSCRDCHGGDLKGGIPPFFAPDLTAETGAAGVWTTAQIVTALKEGTKPDGSQLSPVMPWGGRAFGNLTDADLNAIATYLKVAQPQDIAEAGLPAPQGGDIALSPVWMAIAGMALLLTGFGVSQVRGRRAGS